MSNKSYFQRDEAIARQLAQTQEADREERRQNSSFTLNFGSNGAQV